LGPEPAAVPLRDPPRVDTGHVWRRWVVANAWAELVGLGASGAVAFLVLRGSPATTGAVVAGALGVVLVAGVTEGGIVGWAQHRVLRAARPELPAHRWIIATVVGALAAWLLGMTPATIVELVGVAEDATQTSSIEPGLALQLGLAVILGLVTGPILGGPQAWVLRGHVERAWRWVPANAVAWAAGMPLVFLVAGGLPPSWPVTAIIGAVAATLLLVGAVVGAVHGLVLVRMLADPRQLDGALLAENEEDTARSRSPAQGWVDGTGTGDTPRRG
jgi:hypothetical protein